MEYVVDATLASEVESETTFDEILDRIDITGHAAELLCAEYNADEGMLCTTFQVKARNEDDAIRYVADAIEPSVMEAGIYSKLHYAVERATAAGYSLALWLVPVAFGAAGCASLK